MKPQLAVVAALSGVATASSQPAHAYLFRHAKGEDADASTSIPRQAARLLLQQRLGADESSSLHELMDVVDQETALGFLNRFGQQSAFLDRSAEPSQLVILVEGLDSEQLVSSLPSVKPSFEVASPPCSSAHDSLFEELKQSGVRQNECELRRAIDTQDAECWGDARASVAKFDAQKDTKLSESLDSVASELARLAENGSLETLILLFAESTRNGETKSWSTSAQALHRRQAEAVIASTDETEAAPQPTSSAPRPVFPTATAKGKIQSCFSSFNSCMQATDNCSGHGECRDRWAPSDDEKKRDDDSPAKQCFSCFCLKTVSENNSTTHWAGQTCEKIDVSAPFILFVTFTLFIVAVMAGAVKMLSDVGKEPLPSVLMSGVAKK